MTARAPSLPPGYSLADARLRDTLSIFRLERVAFPRDAYDPLLIAWLLIRPGNVNLKAIAPGGQLVGHITGSPPLLRGPAWIVTLAVAPLHRRRGIGRALLAACEASLNRPTIRLTARAGNAPALALYARSGYRRVRVWPRYYSGGEDGVVMEKNMALDAASGQKL